MSSARASRPVPPRSASPNREHLGGVVPLVDGSGRVEALVALQAQQTPAQGLREGRGELGLAAAGLALQQQRAAEGEAQVEGLDQRVVRDIAPLLEERPRLDFAAWQRAHVVGHAPFLTRIRQGSKGGALSGSTQSFARLPAARMIPRALRRFT